MLTYAYVLLQTSGTCRCPKSVRAPAESDQFGKCGPRFRSNLPVQPSTYRLEYAKMTQFNERVCDG